MLATRLEVTLVEMHVSSIILEPRTRSPILVLKDPDERRAVLIWIGDSEANAILMAVDRIKAPRPLTHDLMLASWQQLGGKVKQITVTRVVESTFMAEIEVDLGTATHRIDARPSDAVAIAVRAGCPIFVHASVMASSSVPVNEEKEEEETEQFRKFLDQLKPSDFNSL